MNNVKILIFILLSICLAESIDAYELTVKLVNSNNNNPIFIAIYNDEESFLNLDMAKFKKEFSFIEENTYIFTNIPPGNYAVSVFQDTNKNKILDKSFWGSPKEPYGFSNNASGNFGPPAFKNCVVTISEDTKIEIELK